MKNTIMKKVLIIILKQLKGNITWIMMNSSSDKVSTYFTRIFEDIAILKALSKNNLEQVNTDAMQVEANMHDAQHTLSEMNHPSMMKLVNTSIDKANSVINDLMNDLK